MICFFLSLVVVLLFVVDILVGSVNIPFDVVWNTLFGVQNDSAFNIIITDFRLPKAITAMLAGSSLAVCGLLMQTLFRNPLAGPFVLGISSGASLGVAIVFMSASAIGGSIFAEVILKSNIAISFAAIIGSGLILLIVLSVSHKIKGSVTLLILGLMFGYIVGAIVNLLEYFSTAEHLQSFVLWGMGSFNNVIWNELYLMMPIVFLTLFASFVFSKQMNVILLGDNYTKSLGINIKRLRFIIIALSGVLGGIITAFCGPIAFIGISVPHIARNIFNSSDLKILIPSSALIGVSLALLCDIISQLPGYDQTLPINTVTSLIGAPIVIWIIINQRKFKAVFN